MATESERQETISDRLHLVALYCFHLIAQFGEATESQEECIGLTHQCMTISLFRNSHFNVVGSCTWAAVDSS